MAGQSSSLRDFSKGRLTTEALSNELIRNNWPNSVADSFNVVFDQIIGSGVARKGTTALGSVVASSKQPLGLSEFVGSGGTPNLILSVFTGASTASVYYYDTSWHTSGLTNLSNTAKVRFATLGNLSFLVNGVVMKSSSDGNTWGTTNCITTDSVVPSLIYKYKARLLASGYSGYRDRVYFSSVISPQSSPTLTWSTNASTGDWIDVNPDDGDNITAFNDASNVLLVFKKKTFYRMDVVTLSVDTEPVFDAGAVSQEAVTKCQGQVYFFSGDAIYRTNGGYPEQISRLAVQDYIDAVPQANWNNVSLGHDTWNVYASLGQVTVNGLTNYVVLKFSTRDETWSVHYYPVQYYNFSQFTDSNGRMMRGAEGTGFVQTINLGTTDNTTPIFYSLETQEQEFGARSHTKVLNDHLAVFTRNAQGSKLEIKEDNKDYKDISGQLLNPVEILENFNIKGKYLKFKWGGVYDSGKQPTFEGVEFIEVKDQGVIRE